MTRTDRCRSSAISSGCNARRWSSDLNSRVRRQAAASPQVLAALRNPDLAAIIICPSNPYLSVDPILAVSDIRKALDVVTAPDRCRFAIDWRTGGEGTDGEDHGRTRRARGLRERSPGIIRSCDGLIIDETDRAEADKIDLPVHVTSTWMRSLEDRDRLAAECLEFAGWSCRVVQEKKGRSVMQMHHRHRRSCLGHRSGQAAEPSQSSGLRRYCRATSVRSSHAPCCTTS